MNTSPDNIQNIIKLGSFLMITASVSVIVLVVYLHRNIQQRMFRA